MTHQCAFPGIGERWARGRWRRPARRRALPFEPAGSALFVFGLGGLAFVLLIAFVKVANLTPAP